MRKLLLACVFALLFPVFSFATMPLGQVPPVVELKGDDGGRVDGSPWSSAELKGKVYYVFYVDPDESDLNEDMVEALGTLDLPEGSTRSVAIINMDATWLPNVAIASKLKDSQEEHPDTTYVKDMDKILVDKWGLDDDNYDVLVIAPDGKVVYSYDGKLNKAEIDKMLSIIKANVQ